MSICIGAKVVVFLKKVLTDSSFFFIFADMMQQNNRKKRVLEVIRQGQIGGGETHLLDLVEFLDREKFEPICLAFTDGEMITRMKAMDVECHVIETQKPFDRKVQQEVITLMRELKIEIVHAHGSRAASNVLLPARKLHLPLVYTVHGWSFHDDQSWMIKKLRGWSEKLICHFAQRVICVSQSNAVTGREVFGLRSCVVIENGINLRRFNPDASYPDLRQEFSVSGRESGPTFSSDDFVVGFIARNTKQKAPLDFLEGIRLAHEKDSSVKGFFIGEGDLDADVNHFIEMHAMRDYLFRSPFRLDVPALLHAIDVYCLPSLWEGLSIALLEAMAMRKAIIATPTDGTRELLTDGENGLVVPFSHPEAIAATILRLKHDKNLFNRCADGAHRLVAERFNAERVAMEVSKIYETLC